ncbi:hypothetical protein N9L31_00075 [bacterium]|nr:hypothetical protein [bacterium]
MDSIAANGGRKVWSVFPGNGGWIAKEKATGKELLVLSATTIARSGFVIGQDSSEDWEAPNGPRDGLCVEGPPAAKTFRINRNSPFKRYLIAHGWREAKRNEVAQLGHCELLSIFVSSNGSASCHCGHAHTCPTAGDTHKAGPCHAEYDCWPRSCTNVIDNIWTFYQRICAGP